jgi:glucosamine-6-phosphate deaminase
MAVEVLPDAPSACWLAANRIAETIRTAVAKRGKAVLGLATGRTPVSVYARLVALHRAAELSFKDVSAYNLDEYYPISPTDPNSYHSYMHRHLFTHVDIAPNRAHVLDGTVPESFAASHAADFDRWIAADGGLDMQLLGVGRNGHIGFNEPEEMAVEQMLALPTRLTSLHPVTIADAARDFGSESNVIRRALTLGVAQIVSARTILILASGAIKAEAVCRALDGPLSTLCPASLLRTVACKVTWVLDEAAAQGL